MPEQRTEDGGWRRGLALTSLSPTLIQFGPSKRHWRLYFFVTGSFLSVPFILFFCFLFRALEQNMITLTFSKKDALKALPAAGLFFQSLPLFPVGCCDIIIELLC